LNSSISCHIGNDDDVNVAQVVIASSMQRHALACTTKAREAARGGANAFAHEAAKQRLHVFADRLDSSLRLLIVRWKGSIDPLFVVTKNGAG
jgi:hypothetical protein